MAHFKSIDDYINSFDGITKERLVEMRKLIESLTPTAEGRISYDIPAYFLNDKLVVYFAGYKNHVGLYPGRTSSEAYNKLAAKYAYGKSTARFPHTEPLPKKIVEQFIRVRLEEIGA